MLKEIEKRAQQYGQKIDEYVANYSKEVIGRELKPNEIFVMYSPGIGTHYYEAETRKCFMFEAEPEITPNGVTLKVTSVNLFKDEK